jgi:ribosomal protein L19E
VLQPKLHEKGGRGTANGSLEGSIKARLPERKESKAAQRKLLHDWRDQ